MNKKTDKKEQRRSTQLHNKFIIKAYNELLATLGKYGNLVPKGYIYATLSEQTGYCTKKIADTINHHLAEFSAF